jgi:hypothetical protein
MYDPNDLTDYDLDALNFFKNELTLLLTVPYIILRPTELIKNQKALVDSFVNIKLAMIKTLLPNGSSFLNLAINDIYTWEFSWYQFKVYLQVILQLLALSILIGIILT